MTPRDRLRIRLNVIFALSQALAPALPALGIGQEVGVRSAQDPSPIVPPDAFFAIWGVIFGFAFAYAVFQARERQREDPLLRRIGFWTAAAFALNTLWIVVAQTTGIELATFAILLGNWTCALVTIGRLVPQQRRFSRSAQLCVLIPFSLLAGWTTAATFLSIAGLMDNYITGSALPEYIAICGGAVVGGFLVIKTRANLWFTLTLAYAFVGIGLRTRLEGRDDLTVVTLISLVVLVVTYLIERRSAGAEATSAVKA